MTEPADSCTCSSNGVDPGCPLHGHLIVELVRDLVRDYERRLATRRGRFLLWLLRKAT